MAPNNRLRLRLQNESAATRLPRTLITRLLADEYARRRARPATVNLLVLADDAIAGYNRRFKRRDGPTDVLAFDDGDEDPRTGVIHLGDIAVSLDTARRVAAAGGYDWRDELALYALHGLLHLLGLRDDTPEGRAAMSAAQTAAFRRLDRPPPPAADAEPGR